MNDLLKPGTFLHRVNFDQKQFEFLTLTREQIASKTFLDERTLGGFAVPKRAPFSDVFEALEGKKTELPPSDIFIFHTGFCCSTLISKALDRPGRILSLREPNAFLNLCNNKRRPAFARDKAETFNQAMATTLRLLNKPFSRGEKILIKPPNVANNLISDIFEINPNAKGILLFQDHESFLISFLKKGEPGHSFGRKLFLTLGLDEDIQKLGFHKNFASLTDLQVISLLWIAQIFQFSKILQTYPNRFFLLNSNQFLSNPEETLIAISRFLKIDADPEFIKGISKSRLFSRNSKFTNQTYSTGERERESNRIRAENSQSLEFIKLWSAPFIKTANISRVTRSAGTLS